MISPKRLVKIAKKWKNFAEVQRETIFTPKNIICCFGKGHFAVYTVDHRRFEVPLSYLNNAIFRQLLKMSEEEFGLPRDGPIVVPCNSVLMDCVMCLIRKGEAGDFQEGDLQKVLPKLVAQSHCLPSCLYEQQMNRQLPIHLTKLQ
ncbi:SAUR-like auxin-responsive protein family [Striga asiatica]|uniref:SAUR-like auxin-responsive protein family n=1 Tax=Striga asiatica TaxID=4170 RepID=A0A5A7PSR8_STRAF|nr:SAUR-like auxin-responsive protein family [Striga asiatica]